jgi:hypothetical protein
MPEHTRSNSYVLCVDDGGYPESLEILKIYVAIEDQRAAERQYIRVIDETGEDYLYPVQLFVPIEVPPEATRILQTRNTGLVDDPLLRRMSPQR